MKGSAPYLILVSIALTISPVLKAQNRSVESEMLRLECYREKFHLFTDRDIYAVNERILFRAFNLSEPQLRQINWSRVLYVELTGEGNRVIARGKFELDNKGIWGSLTIPSRTPSGTYLIRAYTKWMRNYPPEGYVHKPVVIINPAAGWIDQLQVKNDEEIPFLQENRIERKNRVLCTTDKTRYGTREKITVSLSPQESNSISPDGYCVTVVRMGHCDNAVPELISPAFPGNSLPETIAYYPETRGLSLSGCVTASDGNQPLAYARVHLTLLGDRTDYYGFMTDGTGSFRIALPGYARSKDVLFCVESENNSTVKLTLDEGYSPVFIDEEAAPASTRSVNKRTVEEVLFAARINNLFYPDPEANETEQIKDDTVQSFYGYPTVRFIPSDYVELPNLEEFFYELIRQVDIKKEKGRPYFRLIGEHPDLRLFDPLILLDFVPVFDIGQVLSLPPAKISSIDIINWVYIRGDQRYGGILSILTNRGDRAGVDLPPHSFFFPFKTVELQQEISFPDYEKDSVNERTPDFRNCLYWIPDLTLTPGKTFTFDLFSPDNPGDYSVIIRGITGEGEVVQGECVFTVE